MCIKISTSLPDAAVRDNYVVPENSTKIMKYFVARKTS
jgi:hypothetical protein